MGLANAQRMVNYIRIFTEFITQPEYSNVVPVFGIINEALAGTVGTDTLASLCVAVLRFHWAQLTFDHQLCRSLRNHPCDHRCW